MRGTTFYQGCALRWVNGSAFGPHVLFAVLAICALLLTFSATPLSAADLKSEFVNPPDSARPWVYWFWLNSNITKEGMTADLEAMKRAGVGGVLIMEVDQGAPVGPVDFAGSKWRELFKHMLNEAARLGLDVNMNNDAGWCGSGGPWMTPELSMQYVVWTETPVEGSAVEGGQHVDLALKEPKRNANYYRDIRVLAFPTPAGNARIADIAGKTLHDRRNQPPAPAVYAEVPAEQVIKAEQIVDLSAQFKNGRLSWDVPQGKWTVLRIGHTSTGAVNAPAPASGRGLECDKLSKEAVDAMYAGLIGKLVADSPARAGKTLVTTHIDSWEIHSQDWTAKLPEEFQKRRGYDMLRYLPVYTGRIVDSREVSERFLWDLRQTIGELCTENYAGHFRELANKDGLKLSIEAYGDGPLVDVAYAGHCDEPMGEFWSWPNGMAHESCTEMTSAAHVYGKRIIGAEAFTANDGEKWLGHPGNIKSLGDWAFCEGINRFVFHRYAMQPWVFPAKKGTVPGQEGGQSPFSPRPGMSMGPWGLHYERTETWWDQAAAWHQYLARCQHLLRQGLFVADICYLQAEGAPHEFKPPVARNGFPPERPAYNFDGCSPEVVFTRMSVKNGRIVLPDGMSYRALALPQSQTMTPRLLKKIVELVEAGATVVGPRPQKSPALENFPACDEEVKKLADRLWGDCDGKSVTEHVLGKGRVVWGKTPEQVLADAKVPVDFRGEGSLAGKLRYIHRTLEDGSELYFVANRSSQLAVAGTCSFRVVGRTRPELWWPQTGRVQPVAAVEAADGVARLPLYLEPAESVFVVFPGELDPSFDPIVAIKLDGQPLPASLNAGKITIAKAIYGIPGDKERTRDVRAKLQGLIDLGRTSFTVADMAQGDDPAYGIVKTLTVDYRADGKPHAAKGQDTDTIDLLSGPLSDAPRPATLTQAADDSVQLESWQNGRYELTAASGRKLSVAVSGIAPAQTVAGPWQLSFAPGPAAPASRTLDSLAGWNTMSDDAAKYFSGTATYTKTITIPAELLGKDRGLYLDLGRVAVMARVKLNGHDLGVLWKAPYRVEIGEFARLGENELKIEVTNLWINRMIGDENLPEDSDRHPNGTLKRWPGWLLEGKTSPTGRQTFTSWRLWHKGDKLQESGLLGPVILQSSRRVTPK
jgi:hypothetical protein